MVTHTYKDLIVWQKAIDLTLEIYQLSKNFPKEELYSLTNQIRRAAVSIPSNIAEGRCRHSKAEYLQFLAIAQGSLAEVETQMIIAIKLSFISEIQAKLAFQLQEEITKMLGSLRTKIHES